MSAPAVAVSATGTKYVAAWKDVRTGEPNVHWAISDRPEFGESQRVRSATQGTQDHPSVCIDTSGIAWVVWEENRAGKQEVWVRSSHADDADRLISDSSDLAATFPTVATGNDLVAVVYESQRPDRKAIRFRVISEAHAGGRNPPT
jgi:hypothetical protein